jgi:H+-transporting ATPase
MNVVVPTSPSQTPKAADDTASKGLTNNEARARLEKDGPNSMPDTSAHPLRNAFAKLWAPVPWLLEASIVLELVLHKYYEAAIIAGLLVFNAALAYFQEGRAQATLAALKSRLALNASVERDGAWKTVPAAELVRGDLVKLSLGGVVAADVHLTGGSVELDQSMLTGESLPVDAGPGADTFAGALVRRGEATAVVTATGTRTKFGRTAELVRTAHVVSSQQNAVLKIVRNLAIFNGVVILAMSVYAYSHAMPWSEIVPLLLTSVLAAIPVALPATFTLAAALGARSLAKLGVLPTRLSAVDEAASIDVLCSDKTGTLTLNELSVTGVRPMPGFDESHVLGLAALASSDGGQDPVDAAIRSAASHKPASDLPKLVAFVPFDPAKKTSEATATDAKGSAERIVKGAYTAVGALTAPSPTAAAIADELEKQGFRVLAVAAGPPAAIQITGLIALSDPPRTDSSSLISELHALGVATVMVTGDSPVTAAIVAHDVGLTGPVCPPGKLPAAIKPEDFAVFAGVLPEGKYDLVKAYQKGGHTVGMCGDGANDAPALRQAQIGIAVSTATDVAKSAAGVVLTTAGLGGIVAAVRRQNHISAHPHVHVEFSDEEASAGAPVGCWPGHDRARGTHTHSYGNRHDHRRLPLHVADDGQGAAVGDAELMANRQNYNRRRYSGSLFPCLLHGHPGGRKIPVASRHRSTANLVRCRYRVWQPGHNVRHSRSATLVGITPQPLARAFFRRRRPYHFNACCLWNRHGPAACRSNRL